MPKTRPCPDCLGRGYHSEPVTHPSNPMLDTWATYMCTTCNGTKVVEEMPEPLDDYEAVL
jgi:hypothetical protein